MARGKTSIYLKGGKSDGVLIEDVAILKLADTLHVFSPVALLLRSRMGKWGSS